MSHGGWHRRGRRRRAARVGAKPAAGPDMSNPKPYLDFVNVQVEELAKDLRAQRNDLPSSWPEDRWRTFLTKQLPTSFLVPGVAPEYLDGPIGWRDFYRLNRGSTVALAARPEAIIRHTGEYEQKLAMFHKRLRKAGGRATRKAPERPGVPTPDKLPEGDGTWKLYAGGGVAATLAAVIAYAVGKVRS